MIDHASYAPAQCADHPNCGRVFKVRERCVGSAAVNCPHCGEPAEYL